MTEQTLTRNESADWIKDFWSTVVEEAPKSTDCIREFDLSHYLYFNEWDATGIHDDHIDWLYTVLSDSETLDLVDKLAAQARLAGGELAAPWRDESETR